MTNAEAWFNKSLRPRKPEGSLGRTAQDGHLDSHTAPEQCVTIALTQRLLYIQRLVWLQRCLVVIWPVTRETAAVSAHVL